MYGRHFESMYTGSMVGKGSAFFAVWGYVISHYRYDSKMDDVCVELNPVLLGYLLGEDVKKIVKVIGEMCAPDHESRSDREEGRKLVMVGAYLYRVVNGKYYDKIKKATDRREYLREAQQRHRDKAKAQKSAAGSGANRERLTMAEVMGQGGGLTFAQKYEVATGHPDAECAGLKGNQQYDKDTAGDSQRQGEGGDSSQRGANEGGRALHTMSAAELGGYGGGDRVDVPSSGEHLSKEAVQKDEVTLDSLPVD
jgi:hypothetical protein